MADSKSDARNRVLRDFAEAEKHHALFREKAERRYRAYRGIMERRSDAAQWHSRLHPPYILQILETMVANLVDPQPKVRIRPRPKSVAEAQARIDGAQTLERLLAYQLDIDRFAEKQRPFILQGLITGVSVGKTYWKYDEAETRELRYEEEWRDGPLGPYPVSVPRTVSQREALNDDPCFEVVDVRDFLWHEAARDLDSAKYVIHRVWKTKDEILAGERAGYYGPRAGGVKVADALKDTKDWTGETADREQELFNTDRTKGLVEVLEHWTNDRVVTVANRKVLLSDRPNPFWHGRKPFVVTSTMPDLFRIPGISEVEVVEHLQEMLWTLMNQRVDNLRLINNAVTVIASDYDDPEGLERAPGEKWIVDRPDQVVPLPIDPAPASLSLEAEALLRGDIQNITGGMPFMSGTESQTVDQDTATGVSIITNLAQRRLAGKKQNFTFAYKRVYEDFIALDQQFIREPKLFEVLGPDGSAVFLEADPERIQGRYDVVAEPASESLMRQERRAEAQAKLQVAMQAVPVFAVLSQQGQVPALNPKAFMDDFLDAYDIQDKERYYSAVPQVPPAAPSASPQGAPGDSPDGVGVTSPLAFGPNSPSNDNSLSPVAALQQMGAMRGGAVNS